MKKQLALGIWQLAKSNGVQTKYQVPNAPDPTSLQMALGNELQ
jgi:hypothetical protein